MPARLFSFIGGDTGLWLVSSITVIAGEGLPETRRLEIAHDPALPVGSRVAWVLRGITSNERYLLREEKSQLEAKQQGLGRPGAVRAALIPIRKNATWWGLTQDERRSAFEEQSRHIAIGLEYLPAIARRLYHCRDLSANEPFDFLTWFEYAPADERAFNELLARLRASEEWKYVDREVDIRLAREDA